MSRSKPENQNNTLVFAVLLFGISCSAVSFIFIRESVERSIMLAAWRVLIAAALLLPLYLHARARHGDAPFIDILKRSCLPGMILSVHFMAWVAGARLTPGANATLVVNLMPMVMPFFMYFLYREKLQRREWVATAFAIIGILILSINDVNISPAHFQGDMLCLVSMVLFAAYLALARSNLQSVASVWLYVVPMYAVAGVCSLLVAVATGPITPTWEWYNVTMVVLLAAVSTVIGHTALNFAMEKLRGQTVTIMNMLQFVVAGIAGFWMYTETPTFLFYIASAFIICGLLIAVLGPNKPDTKT